MSETPKHIVFFDGVCNLCNGAVDFIIRRDRKGIHRYAPLQGYTAKRILSQLETENMYSIVYYSNGERYVKSTAVLLIFFRLGGAWKLISVLFIFPRFIRDWVYDFVAKYRYRWFGMKESCRMPLPHEKKLFLD